MYGPDALILATRPTFNGNLVFGGGIILILVFAISAIGIIGSCFSSRPRTQLIAAAYGAGLLVCTAAVLFLVFHNKPAIEFHTSGYPDEGSGLALLLLVVPGYLSAGFLLLASLIALLVGCLREPSAEEPPVCSEWLSALSVDGALPKLR